MAQTPFASRNTDNPVSLQNAVAHMISNPHAFITKESSAVLSFDLNSRSYNSQAHEPHGRSTSQEQQLQGRNDTENQASYRSDNQRQRSYESSIAQRQQLQPEGHEQIRNELEEIDIPLVADNDLQIDSIENPSNSDIDSLLPTTSNFMADSFCLLAGRRVRSPQYSTYKERLGTFKKWPDHLTQRPKELTQAGFYFLGTADVVRCFACDGGLKNWEPEDDPWIEHARWFSGCDYLRDVKGEEFIQLVRLMDEESAEEDENPAVNGEEQVTEYIKTLNLDGNQGKTETSVLDADCAQSVIQTGFSDMAVVRGINHLLSKGEEEYGALDILNVILAKEEEGNISSISKHSNTCRNEAEISRCVPDAANSMVKANEALKRQMMCMECEKHERNMLFLPCKHRTVCEKCSPHIYVCFTCFRRVRQKVKTYMS